MRNEKMVGVFRSVVIHIFVLLKARRDDGLSSLEKKLCSYARIEAWHMRKISL